MIKLLRFCGLEIFGFEACRFIQRVLKLGRYNLGLLITLRAIIKFWLEHLQRLVVLTLRDQAIRTLGYLALHKRHLRMYRAR